MHFDASPTNQRELFKALKKDPAVTRATMLKMGEKLEDIAWKQAEPSNYTDRILNRDSYRA